MAKAPGKNFRKGISLIEIVEMFPDDLTAEAWFEEQRWGISGAPTCCPLCGDADRLTATKSRKPLPYWCGSCRRHFSVRSGTVMHRSHIPLRKWAIAIYLWATSLKGVSSMKLHRDLGVTQKTAWHLGHRIREALEDHRGLFAGPVEIDETYVGGIERNKHNRKKLRAGRGAVGKTAVVGVKKSCDERRDSRAGRQRRLGDAWLIHPRAGRGGREAVHRRERCLSYGP